MSYEKLSIKSWSKEDRPREKLATNGPQFLSTSELLAILIRSGNDTDSAVSLSQRILLHCKNKLATLAKMPLNELMTFKGIGQAKAISIMAALELAKRRSQEIIPEKPTISSSENAYQYLKHKLEGLDHEQFWVLFLDRANHALHTCQISKGGISATVVDPKVIFKHALTQKASSIILFHNHPSGNIKPSQIDFDVTQKIKKGAQILEITLMDHIIVGQNTYFSFADEQQL